MLYVTGVEYGDYTMNHVLDAPMDVNTLAMHFC
jgi:hypothetical protein